MANSTTHPAERDTALKLVQDLMLAYNLDEAAIGASDDGKRGQEKLTGGFYEYERDLMARIADVHFCLYWTSRDWIKRSEASMRSARVQAYRDPWVRTHQQTFQHHLVGRRINVEACIRMYRYIGQTTERLCREFIAPGSTSGAEVAVVGLAGLLRSRRAVSFREGVAEEVSSKLWERRQGQLAEERQKAAEEKKRADEAAAAGVSSSTAMTISALRQSERDENMDHLYGEGWSAKQRAEAAAEAQRVKEAEEAYTKWAAANPEAAAAEEAERRKAEKKRANRSRGGWGRAERERDYGALAAGREAGRSVGVDPQAEHRGAQRRIA